MQRCKDCWRSSIKSLKDTVLYCWTSSDMRFLSVPRHWASGTILSRKKETKKESGSARSNVYIIYFRRARCSSSQSLARFYWQCITWQSLTFGGGTRNRGIHNNENHNSYRLVKLSYRNHSLCSVSGKEHGSKTSTWSVSSFQNKFPAKKKPFICGVAFAIIWKILVTADQQRWLTGNQNRKSWHKRRYTSALWISKTAIYNAALLGVYTLEFTLFT